MPDDYLYCPACNSKLRISEEMLGAVVQCPQCGLVFTTPTRGGVVPDENYLDQPSREQARAEVRRPAIGLLVTGILGTLVNLAQAGMALFLPELFLRLSRGSEQFLESLGIPTGGATPQDRLLAHIAVGTIFAALNLFLIVAAWKMLRMRSFGLALAGAMLALVNCGNTCFLLSWPFGIWALRVLLQPKVKRAFE
jgi:predicted Zn finger-like uncharacterized protein